MEVAVFCSSDRESDKKKNTLHIWICRLYRIWNTWLIPKGETWCDLKYGIFIIHHYVCVRLWWSYLYVCISAGSAMNTYDLSQIPKHWHNNVSIRPGTRAERTSWRKDTKISTKIFFNFFLGWRYYIIKEKVKIGAFVESVCLSGYFLIETLNNTESTESGSKRPDLHSHQEITFNDLLFSPIWCSIYVVRCKFGNYNVWKNLFLRIYFVVCHLSIGSCATCLLCFCLF